MKRTILLTTFIIAIMLMLLFFQNQLRSPELQWIREEECVTFHDVLYAPEDIPDLATGTKGGVRDYWHSSGFSRARTSVADISLEPGTVYGITGDNLTYAVRIWVNGELLIEQGTVADNEKEFVPHTGKVTAYFTAQSENRIVVQRANFNHDKWNYFNIAVGVQQDISRYVVSEYMKSAALIIFFLTVGILNLGMSTGLPNMKRYLFFALSCFGLVLNFAFSDPKPVMVMFPGLNWYLGHRLETAGLIFAAFFLMLFFRECFGSVGRVIDILGFVITGLVLGYYFLLPSRIYTVYAVPVSDVFIVYMTAYCALVIIRSLRKPKELTYLQKYCLGGILIIALGAVLGTLRVGPYMELLKTAMVLFEIVLTVGLIMEFQTIQKAYENAVFREAELKQRNEGMAQAQDLQKNFMAIMNHEMRTPLTIIAGYADKVSMQVQEESAQRSLTVIKKEALRLGRIIEQSDNMAVLSGEKAEEISLAELFADVQSFCMPICEKRHNTIVTEAGEEMTLYGVRDGLQQALYNLVINGSRHTQNGIIRITATENGQETELSVRDSGDGMDDETLAHAFERGYTKDNGHGIGLPLCRDIVEYNGGRIWIMRNEPESGITVHMSFPKREETVDV